MRTTVHAPALGTTTIAASLRSSLVIPAMKVPIVVEVPIMVEVPITTIVKWVVMGFVVGPIGRIVGAVVRPI
jgi:hypothetical protein